MAVVCGTSASADVICLGLPFHDTLHVFLRFDSGYSSHDSLWRHSLPDFGNILTVGGKRCLSAAFGIVWLLLLPNAVLVCMFLRLLARRWHGFPWVPT